jgi:hypothetical protein
VGIAVVTFDGEKSYEFICNGKWVGSGERLLQKNGFKYCGIIYLEDQEERIAFEKIL